MLGVLYPGMGEGGMLRIEPPLPYHRFTVGLAKPPPYHHPFHCWASKDSLSDTRFTVGL